MALTSPSLIRPPSTGAPPSAYPLRELAALERRALWLSTWLIHNANHLRPSRDGLKVGGHQSSSASVSTLMTALYFHALRPQDRIAVKPHASPVMHAIEYLLGRQTRDQLERFRALGGAQSYPSRTKDKIDVDFSTGSVGLGVAATLFASITQNYVGLHGLAPPGASTDGRMIALLGDAELDEGNIYEALLEGWKHDVRNLWWIIDYNRQSLDGVVNDALFHRIEGFFRAVDWRVVPLKFGKRLEAARCGPAGEALLDWIERCPNQLYSALTFKGGAAWRERLKLELAGATGLRALLDGHKELQARLDGAGDWRDAAVILPLDDALDLRALTAMRLARWLRRKTAGPDPTPLSAARRTRLVQVLRALDARADGASRGTVRSPPLRSRLAGQRPAGPYPPAGAKRRRLDPRELSRRPEPARPCPAPPLLGAEPQGRRRHPLTSSLPSHSTAPPSCANRAVHPRRLAAQGLEPAPCRTVPRSPPVSRRATCARRRPPASSACRTVRWKSTAHSAPGLGVRRSTSDPGVGTVNPAKPQPAGAVAGR